MSLFSEDFTLLCNWDSFTHMQSSFPRNLEEEPGRLQENYSHLQNPECCTSPTDLCKKTCEETRGIPTLIRISVTVLYVHKPWNKKGQFSQVYNGRELSFNQGDHFPDTGEWMFIIQMMLSKIFVQCITSVLTIKYSGLIYSHSTHAGLVWTET